MGWTNLTFTLGQILTADAMNDIQANLVSVRTSEFGSSPPAFPTLGTDWWDSGTEPWYRKTWDGTEWVRVSFLDPTAHEGGLQAENHDWGNIPMVDVSKNRTDFAGTPQIPRNMLLNGAMRFWQRGNSHQITGAVQYTADRWKMVALDHQNLKQFSVRRSNDAPISSGLDYSLEVVVNSGGSVASGTCFALEQPIEGNILRRALFGSAQARYTRLSFYVWSLVTGRMSVYLSNGSRTVSYLDGFTVTASSAWQFKQIGYLPPSSGSWDLDLDVGARLGFVIAAASHFYTATPRTWLFTSPDVRAASGQLNGLTVGNIFKFTGVQFELGQMSTPFEHLPDGLELNLLRRYYYKTFAPDVRPRSNVDDFEGVILSVCDNAGQPYGLIRLPTPMRTYGANATYAMYNPFNTGTTWHRNRPFVAGNQAIATPDFQSIDAALITASPTAAHAGEAQSIHVSIDAELS